jgi:peptidyl-prolyl cis-trans isomerase C
MVPIKKKVGAKIGKEIVKPAKDEKPLPPVTGKDGLIAKVNGEGIALALFTEKYDRFTQTFKARKRPVPNRIDSRYRDSIVKRLIEETLIAQEAKSAQITVDPKLLAEEFDKYKAMFKTDERFQSYLKNARLTADKVKENLKQNLTLRVLLEKLSGDKVTEVEVKKYYEENQAKYKVREQVRARHILLKLAKDATPEQVAEVKARADKLSAEARKNNTDEAFAALAKKNSEGPTAPRGGDLSFFTRNRMVKEFDEKAFSMKVGEVSEPVKTRFGWHVIRVVERKDERMRPFDEVKDGIERTLTNRMSRTARQKLIDRLRAKAKIETYLPK